MQSKVEAVFKEVTNPNTSKSLFDESRLVSINGQDSELIIEYRRDGIDPQQKRALEGELRTKLAAAGFDEITLKTVSTDRPEVTQEKQKPESKANLQAGHGPVGANKKRIPGVGKVLAVSSCKGGVGKSTVAVNLAYALTKAGNKVGVLDADIYGPSVPTLIGKTDAKPIASESKKILPVEKDGVKFMSFGFFIPEGDAVIWRGPMLGGVLNQFFFDVDWGELDYLILDLPPGTGDVQLSMTQLTEIDAALIVTTPQNLALKDTIKGINMFTKVKIPTMGMVENMSYFVTEESEKKYYIFGESRTKEVCQDLEVPFIGQLPIDIDLRSCSDLGTPYMSQNIYEGHSIWKSYLDLAYSVEKYFNKTSEKKGFFSKLFNK